MFILYFIVGFLALIRFFSLQRLPLIWALEGFFSLLKSFVDVNKLFPWFSHVLWQRLCKTTSSLRAEWNSLNTVYSLCKGFQVVYLFDCMKTREPWTNCQGLEIQTNERYHTDKGKKLPLTEGCFRKWIL